MELILSPVTAFNNLLNLDRKVALPLVAGMAVVAAATIVTTWQVDIATIGLMGLYLVALGITLIILANAVSDPTLGKVLGWFVTILIIATISCFFVSAVFREQGLIKPTYCLVRFWEPCSDAEASVIDRNPQALRTTDVRPAEVRAASEAMPQVRPENHRVYVQFAGLIAREEIVSLIQALRSAGWEVQGDRGHREPDAQGLNEVRYGRPEDEQAARALAAAVTAAGIGAQPLGIQLTPMIGEGPLEVWMSE